MRKKIIGLILCIVMCLFLAPAIASATEPSLITSIEFTLTGYTYGSPVDEATFACNTPGVTIVAAKWSLMGNFGSSVPATGNFLARNYSCSLFIKNDDGYEFDSSLDTSKITVNGSVITDWTYFDKININTAPGSTRRFLAYYPTLPSPCEGGVHSYGEWEQGNGTHYSSCLICGCRRSQTCKYGELSVITPATVSSEGCEAMPCTVCGYIKYLSEKKIPKLGYITIESDKYGFSGSPVTPPVKAYDIDGLEIPGDNYEVTYDNNEAIGTATATVTFRNKYSGVLTADYEIVTGKTLDSEKFSLEYGETSYDGMAKAPAVISDEYTDGTDYYVEYTNNVLPGLASAVITGKGEYVGTVTKYFTIKKAIIDKIHFTVENFAYGQPLDDVTITTDTDGINIIDTFWYIRNNNGSSDKASGSITCEEYSMGIFMSIDTGYEYADNLATEKNFTVTGVEMAGKDKIYFDVVNTNKVPGSDHRFYVYLKQLPSPCTEHTFGPYDEYAVTTHSCRCINCGYKKFGYHSYGEEFKTDETSHWTECSVCGYRKDVALHSGGKATCTEKARCTVCNAEYGTPAGHKKVTDKAVSESCTKNGKTEGSHCSVCNTVIKPQKLIPKTNHNFKSAVAVKATMTADGKITQTCTACGTAGKATVINKASGVKISASSFTYNGKVQKPVLTVTDSKGKTISSKYYTAVWSNASSKSAGSYTVKVTFKGNYSGTKTFTYKILPKQVTGLKATVTASSVKLTWTKASGAKYYKVEKYNPSTKKWSAVNTVDKNTCTVSGLIAGKKYQFRVTALDSTKKIAGKASTVLKTGTLTKAPAVTLKSSKSKTATVSWKNVTGASKYIVYKSTDGKKWTKVTTTTKLSYTLTRLTGGKKIYVTVKAVNAYGKISAASKTVNTTVKK
ncbi:MAG: fibronectin type III domain-containing protein [Clostridia bacterium]|nr:fibronectin type III domain-containing protein [Clostridia bacterium]